MFKFLWGDDQPMRMRFVLLWLFSLTLFLIAGQFLLDSIMSGFVVGIVVSGAWLVNVVVSSFSIHILLVGVSRREEIQHENVND